MKFLHLSDAHIKWDYQADYKPLGLDVNPHEVFRDFLANYNYDAIDFVLMSGDMIGGGRPEDYQAFKEIMDSQLPSDLPVYYCLGNHDKKAAFRQVILETEASAAPYYYQADFAGYRLLVLDTGGEDRHHGELDPDQEAWLIERLQEESAGGQGTLIFQHHPIGLAWGELDPEMVVSDRVLEALEASDVLAIFTGHLHENRHSRVAGVPQHTAASLAFGISERDGESWFCNKLGYSLVTVCGQQVDVFTETLWPQPTYSSIKMSDPY
ncbi:metallophosphoesterase family protein [Hutsoniella sourekii]|uniref:metallophosphoesterase family protein n=1 Tax=Hutsoniella sourekii TaxID=87650 RepID=UPI000482695E|nr:metallophosphoesterase [Hutsoniella sourekii]